MTESTEIQTTEQKREPKPPLTSGGSVAAIVPRDMDEAWRFTGAIMRAGMVPLSYEGKTDADTRAKLMMGIQQGLEIGVPPLTALKNIAIINNRPTIWGDLAVALVQDAGVLTRMEEEWSGPDPEAELNNWPRDFGVTVKLYRKGQDAPYVGTFTVGDAQRAKLWCNPKKDPWMKYPKRMLKWRALGFAIRDGFADCLAGMAIREEIEDMPAEPERKTDTAFLDDKPALEGAQDATDVAPDTAEAEDTAETEDAPPEAPDEPEDAAPADENPAEPAEAMPDLVDGAQETPEQEARRHAQRAIEKLADAETTNAVNEAWRLYGEGACDVLRAAGLTDEADQLKDSFDRAAMEPAQA